ncbi:hypothetical protein [Nocardioides sp. YIM 152315]|uniref:hypothetical protein n=1 Tax=Nocardioides sp. YIM 152315 TaxID=3031760 RepID=UPI0023DB2684|nr:hypothetical protein [Nocardioides sp. YIM 152315]MDF1603961.1 hypothetical protein [Nocardioides sp. YIM 152315]
MGQRVLTFLFVLTCAGGLLAAGSTSAGAASPEGPSAGPSAQAVCREAAGNITVRHRAPVHTGPSGRSPIDFIAAAGRTFRLGGYCDNSAGNRWYCVARCEFSGTPSGLWIWEEYFRA